MKTYSLDEVQDDLLRKQGTPERDKFEYELQVEVELPHTNLSFG